MKGRCKYCGVDLPDKANIRCDTCDFAWQDGYKDGERSIRNKLKEIFRALTNLAKPSQ